MESKEQKFLTFNLGKLNHPIYGSASKELTGKIPLFKSKFNPSQVLQIPALKTEEFKAFAEKSFQSYQELFEDDLDEDLIEKVMKKSLEISFLIPSTVLDSIHEGSNDIHLYLSLLLLIEANENVLNDVMPTITNQEEPTNGPKIIEMDRKAEQFLQVIGYYFSSKNEDKDNCQLPLVTPALKALLVFAKKYVKNLRAGITDFKLRIQPFKKEVEKVMYAYISKGKALRDGEGESTDFASAEAQCTLLNELFAFLNHAEVAPEIRKSEGFKKFVLKCPEVCGILRTIILLDEDVKEERVPFSSILRSIVMRKTIKDLQEGFDLYYERLIKGLEEMRQGAKMLRETYPKDEKLEKFMQGVENYFNGNLYSYSHARGYTIN